MHPTSSSPPVDPGPVHVAPPVLFLSPKRPRAGEFALCALVAALVLLVYWPALHYGFAPMDDKTYLTENPLLASGLSLDAVRRCFTTVWDGYWLPLTWLSYLADLALQGTAPFGFHLTNVLLHAANSALVLLLLHRATGALGRSAAVALLFALHPLRVESVVWLTERKDVLSSFFLLLSLGAWGHYTRTLSLRVYAGCLALWALAAAAKPTAVVFPALLAVLDLWPLHRWNAAPRRRLVIEKLLPLALALALAALTLWTQHRAGALIATTVSQAGPVDPLDPIPTQRPLWAALEQPLKAYAFYLGKLFWPVNLGITGTPADWPGFDTAGVARAGALLAALSAGCWLSRRSRPYLAAGWCWYLAALLPCSGLVAAGGQWLADRFTYLPHLGLLTALVWGIAALFPRAAPRLAPWVLCAAAGAGLVALTRTQVGYWSTPERLLTHSVEAIPRNWMARLLLGRERATAGDLASAATLFREVTALIPQLSDGHYHLAMALAAQGRDAEALPSFRAASRLRPLDPEIHFNLAVALSRTGDHGRAALQFGQTLSLRSDDFRAAFGLGHALFWAGNPAGAAEAFELARSLQPESAATLYNLATALDALGKTAAAADLRRESLRLRPGLLTEPGEQGLLPRPRGNP